MAQYKEKAKELITSLYIQGNPIDHDVVLSTYEVYKDLTTLLPSKSIDEYDVYDILSNLFSPYYTSSTKFEVQLKENGEPEIVENTREGVKYLWYLKRI